MTAKNCHLSVVQPSMLLIRIMVTRRTDFWLLCLLMLVSLAVRLEPAHQVFGSDMVRLFTDDPPYHAHRVATLLEAVPRPGQPDPFVAHPYGATAHWPWGFDWVLAALAAPLAGDPPDREVISAVCALSAPVLGALLLPLVFLMVGAVAGRRTALIATALVAILPAHADYSLVGRADHHVIEPLFLALATLGPLCRLTCGPHTPPDSRFGLIGSGLAAGMAFGFVPAALPLSGLVVAILGLALTTRQDRSAVTFSGTALVGTAVSLTLSPHPFQWVFNSPSLLQVTLMGLPFAGFGLGHMFSVRRAGASMSATWVVIALGGMLSFGMAFWLLPGFRTAFAEGLGYLGSYDIAALSLEAQPLWSDLDRAGDLLTWLAPLSLVGTVALLLPSGNRHLAARRSLGLLSLALLVLALAQRRFLMAATPFYVLGLAHGLILAWGLPRATLAFPGVRRTAWATFFLAVVALGLAPSIHHMLTVQPLSPRDRAMYQAAETLSNAPFRPDRGGVLAPWSYGHLFQYSARRPTVCDNFFGVPENDRALRTCLGLLLETDPRVAAARLRELRVGFVVLTPPHPDEVRVHTRLLGLAPGRFVDSDDRFTQDFAGTLWAVLGLWAQRSDKGDRGPLGSVLMERIRERDKPGGPVLAEVLVFTVDPVLDP